MSKKSLIKNEKKVSELSNKDKLINAKQLNEKNKEKTKFKHIRLHIFSIISVLLVLLLLFILAIFLNKLKYDPYVKYENKMRTYGFDTMYNNKSAKTSESVTKAEALKLAIGAVFNTYDISGIAVENNEYENSIWVQYARDTEITKEDINSSNFSNKVKYIDVISYFENCKIKFLKEQAVKNNQVNLKDITKYSAEEQAAIKDMVANEIIYVLSENLNGDDYIFKGQLNELVVNFVEKYNTISFNGDKLNVSTEKIPSNADQYPYTLASVDKSIYELPFFVDLQSEYLSPKQLYNFKKEIYPQIESRAEAYFNNMLDIDYKTITEKNLKEKLEMYLIYPINETIIKEYVKYVKDNEIVITGNSKLQFPVIYFDGMAYRARIRLKFEIKHSKTDKDLLYLDGFSNLKKTYQKKSYDILVDYYLLGALGNNNMYLDEYELYPTILEKDKCGITREEYKEVE